MNDQDKNQFTKAYKISMPLSGIAISTFLRNGGVSNNSKFAFLDYDVKKGFKWRMTFFRDEGKANPILEVEEKKLSLLTGQSGYEVRDVETGNVSGVWVPKKRFLNMFLRASYEYIEDGKVILKSPGESFLKLFVPRAIRSWIARKVITADGRMIAKMRVMATVGCGIVSVKPVGEKVEDRNLAVAMAVLAAICGLQDYD